MRQLKTRHSADFIDLLEWGGGGTRAQPRPFEDQRVELGWLGAVRPLLPLNPGVPPFLQQLSRKWTAFSSAGGAPSWHWLALGRAHTRILHWSHYLLQIFPTSHRSHATEHSVERSKPVTLGCLEPKVLQKGVPPRDAAAQNAPLC